MIQAFLATFGAVFVAEIAGDKLLYTTGALASQYPARSIVYGMAAAFMLKMGVAVMFGRLIAEVSPLLVAAVTTVTLLSVAFTLGTMPESGSGVPRDHSQPKAMMISFASVFFSEWGDIGQLTAASMAARYASPFIVWLGAVAAMVSKGALTASLGAGLRGWLGARSSPRLLRYGGVTVLAALGLLSALQALVSMR
jgi:putative Ca2+/H+ antiporter (TMEM165/GDT1 family)